MQWDRDSGTPGLMTAVLSGEQVCAVTDPCGAYICYSGSGTAHSGEKLLSHTLQWNNLPALGNLHWGWAGPSLTSQTFEILATASAWRHCVSLWIFSPSIGSNPGVRKCLTALQKQRLSEITAYYVSVIHLCFTFIVENVLTPQTGTQWFLTSLKSSGLICPEVFWWHRGRRWLLTFDPLSC